MYPYHAELSKRIEKLTAVIKEKTAALQNVPQETLRVSGSANRKQIQYYLYETDKNKNGTYLPVKEKSLIKALAQKVYDQKILRSAQRELSLLLRLQKGDSEFSIEEIYSHLSIHRQKLVTPIDLPDEEYIRLWKSQPFTPKGFDESSPEHYTSRGERVRSKSEILIADTLTELNIPYLYEKPLRLGSAIIHPDFTILQMPARRTLFLEHFGMMDDPDYAGAAVSRIHLYIRNNIFPGDRLIPTFETKSSPLNTKLLKLQFKGLAGSSEIKV